MILVIGDLILDVFQKGKSRRLSPEAPVPVITGMSRKIYPGGAANLALNLADMGIITTIRGQLGRDEEAYILDNMITQHPNIRSAIGFQDDANTTVKTRIIANGQQIARLDVDGIYYPISILEVFEREEIEFDIVVVSDYDKGVIGDLSQELKILKDRGIRTLIDPKKDFDHYKNAWLIKPNLKEFFDFVGPAEDPDHMYDLGSKALRKYNIEYMLVTLGHQGMALISQREIQHFPALECDVYDITGAGDSALAGLVYGLNKGKSLIDSIELAQKAASVAISHHGVYRVTEKELKNKTVFANGVFDILHAGHIKLLEQARRLGDRLIVGINSDTSVKKLKGDNRPINDEKTRAHTLKQFSCVDDVIVFDEDTPYDLIKKLKPDIIVKGGDYTVDQVVGKELVDEVVIIPLEEGYSTTKIIGNING
jgi:D-beta-D-heptose 7-phosphate kinase/D-beta-D-heptose 1-phosphate adenosyltransferase